MISRNSKILKFILRFFNIPFIKFKKILVTYIPNLKLLKEKIKIFENFKIIIVDASPKKFKVKDKINLNNNLNIIKIKNIGKRYANNIAIKSIKTKYAIYIDLDADFSLQKVSEIYKNANNLKNWSILIPNSNKKFVHLNRIMEIDNCEASVFFLNIEKVRKYPMFDENIFFYFEELDYFSRLNKTQDKVLLIPKISFTHIQGGSVDKKIVKDVSNLQQWHYLWSMYYVNKKVFNSFYALKVVAPLILKDIIKIILYLMILKFDLATKRYFRLSGVLNSIIGRKSFKRPSFDV